MFSWFFFFFFFFFGGGGGGGYVCVCCFLLLLLCGQNLDVSVKCISFSKVYCLMTQGNITGSTPTMA